MSKSKTRAMTMRKLWPRERLRKQSGLKPLTKLRVSGQVRMAFPVLVEQANE